MISAEWTYTVEVRWFFPMTAVMHQNGPPQPPTAVRDWFRRTNGRWQWPPAPRTDQYLILPEAITCGVKLRQGRFEVKALAPPAAPITFGEAASGQRESWVKWSYNGEAADPWTTALQQEATGWLAVTKWRWLRAFATQGHRLVEIPTPAPIPALGTVELTAIRAAGQTWWTLGLEANGRGTAGEDGLQQLGDHFFGQETPPLSFKPEASYAYPAWINQLVRDQSQGQTTVE